MKIKRIVGVNPCYYRLGSLDLLVQKQFKSDGKQLIFRLRTPKSDKKIKILKIISIGM